MNKLQDLFLDLEIAWFWALSKTHQSLRGPYPNQKNEFLVIDKTS